jgi:L-amino acid N-acyltransferase YncA
MSDIELKAAREDDWPSILEIYNYYIVRMTASFRPVPVFIDTLKTFLWLDHPKYRTFLISDAWTERR